MHNSYVGFYTTWSMALWNTLTATTESLAATASISAQETTPGHKLSTWDFMVSITSKPLMELALGNAVFSPVKLVVSSNSTDASHPWNQRKDGQTKWKLVF